MIKFIATDMDGTLLNSKKELSPEFYDVFEELKKRNILLQLQVEDNIIL